MTPAERAVLARYPDAECWRTPTGGYTVYDRGRPDNIVGMLEMIVEGQGRLGTGPTPDAAWANAAARLDIIVANSHIPSVPGSPVPSARPLPERTAQ